MIINFFLKFETNLNNTCGDYAQSVLGIEVALADF